MYALDRSTGKKLWQIDAGFDALQFILDPDGKHVTVSTVYNKRKKKYEQHIRRIRISDGATVWETVRKEGEPVLRMTAARKVVVLYQEPFHSADRTVEGEISVLDAVTGKMRW